MSACFGERACVHLGCRSARTQEGVAIQHSWPAAGLRYAGSMAHALLHGLPAPVTGIYAPICSPPGLPFGAVMGTRTAGLVSGPARAIPGWPPTGESSGLGWDLPRVPISNSWGSPAARPSGPQAAMGDRRRLPLRLVRGWGEGGGGEGGGSPKHTAIHKWPSVNIVGFKELRLVCALSLNRDPL